MSDKQPEQLKEKDNFVLVRPFKSMAVAILLALFLGPIGLLYSSFLGGVIMAIIVFIFIAATSANPGVQPLVWVAWLVCPFWAVLASGRHNKKLLKRWEDRK